MFRKSSSIHNQCIKLTTATRYRKTNYYYAFLLSFSNPMDFPRDLCLENVKHFLLHKCFCFYYINVTYILEYTIKPKALNITNIHISILV
jgi:hypothetical protein